MANPWRAGNSPQTGGFARVRAAPVELLIRRALGAVRVAGRSSGLVRACGYLRENFTLAGTGGRMMRVHDLLRATLEASPAA